MGAASAPAEGCFAHGKIIRICYYESIQAPTALWESFCFFSRLSSLRKKSMLGDLSSLEVWGRRGQMAIGVLF